MKRNWFLQALEKGIDVPKMNDHQLRGNLNDYNITAGPVIGKLVMLLSASDPRIFIVGYTRAIYQRKLLEAISNENSEGKNE